MDKIEYSPKDIGVFKKLSNQGPLGKRALFIFQYLFLRKDFKDLVIKIRTELEIPIDGYNPFKDEDVKEFTNQKGYIGGNEYIGELLRQTMTKS